MGDYELYTPLWRRTLDTLDRKTGIARYDLLSGPQAPVRRLIEKPYGVAVIAFSFAIPIFIGTYAGIEHLKERCDRPAIEAPSIEPHK